jgi:outer membrane protein assembly factor BamB
VYALDRETGELLWQISNIVYGSNVAYSPKIQVVYALRDNGDLLAINENTGESSTAAKFSSVPFLFNISENGESYELAYDQEQDILLVALGDSHQLYAFREEE